jgi:hypothetical protein
MLIKDLSNSALGGSSFPMVTYTPLQLFGDKLWIWYDFNDISTLYSDTGATTNISNSGQIIKYVINKGKDRNYDLRSVYPTALTGSSNSVSVFQRNSLNTNKNSSYINFTGATNNAGFGSLQSISGTSTSGSSVSALTVSGVIKLGPASNSENHTVGGIRGNRFIISFVRPASDVIVQPSVNLRTGVNLTIPNVPKKVGETYFYYTFTIDVNNNFYININNKFEYTTLLTGNPWPVVPSFDMTSGIGKFALYFYDGTVQTIKAISGFEVIEYCASYQQILTTQQIANLHQYYKVKYNL